VNVMTQPDPNVSLRHQLMSSFHKWSLWRSAFYADSLGLTHVLDRIEYYRARQANNPTKGYWKPAGLLEQLSRQGKSFTQWDGERAPAT